MPIIFLFLIHCWYWGEGSATTMGSRRVFETKIHGLGPKVILESSQAKHGTLVQKRSLRRALNRIQTHGWTWYKGQLWGGVKSESQTTHEVSQQSASSPNVMPTRQTHRKRMTVFNWNAGGLSQAGWDVLLHWLRKQKMVLKVSFGDCFGRKVLGWEGGVYELDFMSRSGACVQPVCFSCQFTRLLFQFV